MDTIEFFNKILPVAGMRCAVAIGKNGRPQQVFGPDNAWLANTCSRIDGRAANAYHGCATFQGGDSRKAGDAVGARSFWGDLDVGDASGKYPTIQEAAKALLQFCRDVGLPSPLVVKSGRGLHAYWCMAEDMTPDEWLPVARMLKRAAAVWGLKLDPSRTADIASILRPPGTHHRKGEPRLVKVLAEGETGELAAFRAALERQVGKDDLEGSRPAARAPASVNDDLSGGMEYPPSSAEKIAKECAVIQLMRDTRGNVDQPTWYGALGVIAFAEEGAEKCHEWSDGHPQYSPDETDRKIAQASKFAPTTCAKLSEAQPDLCQNCPHFGKIVSPISLGFQIAATTQVEVEPVEPSEPARQITLPRNYRCINVFDRNILQYGEIETDDGGNEVIKWKSICDTLFYPVTRIDHGGEQGHEMELEMHLRDNKRRRFKIPHGVIAKGGNDLAEALGRHEIMAYPRMENHMKAYLQEWARDLREKTASVRSYNQFGWHGDSFLLGRTLLVPGGHGQAILKEGALDYEHALAPRGQLSTWKDLVDEAYNYPGQEALQFMVLCSFAAPLFSLFREYGGVTVYAHSEGSGVGKTTAQRVGLSAWGDWYDLQLAEGKVTQNYLWTAMGTCGTLPVLFDELTNQPSWLASELVYSVSSGRNKKRLTRSGRAQADTPNWSTILLTSGNNLLSEKLAQHRGNPEAELHRLFEFTVTSSSKLSPNRAAALFPQFREHCGHAGLVFARYVVDNKALVEKLLRTVQEGYNSEAEVTQKERFWSALHAAVLTSLAICRKLDLLQFDPVRLKRWMRSQMGSNRVNGRSITPGAAEQFGEMLGDLLPGLLITEGQGDLRAQAGAKVLVAPRGKLAGRVVQGIGVGEDTRLYLAVAAAREWCGKRGISAKALFEAGVHAGWIEPKPIKYVLGKGTIDYAAATGQQHCWVVNPELAGVGSVVTAEEE